MLVTFFFTSPATAQDEFSDINIFNISLEDLSKITISNATRREMNVQDIGISITVLSDSEIKESSLNNNTELYQQVPGLSHNAVGGQGNLVAPYLRGVGINDFNDNQESPVGIYIDDVYLAFTGGFTFPLFDMDRVEVLRGPQGTLFGRNVTGGLVHFINKKPTNEFDSNIRLTLAQENQFRVEGMINGSLGNQSSGRFAFFQNKHDPYVSNSAGKNGNEADNYGFRSQLLFQPQQDLNILLSAHYAKNDIDAWRFKHQATYFDNQGIARKVKNDENPYGTCNGCDPLGYKVASDNPFDVDMDFDGYLQTDTAGISANITLELDWAELTLISNYTEFEKSYLEDTDGTPINSITFGTESDVSQMSQEIRLNGETNNYRWLVGAYYLSIDLDSQLHVDTGAGHSTVTHPSLNFFNGNGWIINYDLDQQTKNASIFSQLEYDILPNWTLIGGLRYSNETKSFDFLNTLIIPELMTDIVQIDFGENTMGSLAKIQSDDIQSTLALQWKPYENLLIYSSIARGVKAGAFNAPIFQLELEAIPVDKETLTSIEMGFKSELLDGKSQVNFALFYFDYDDYQAFSFNQTSSRLFNAQAMAQGIDFEFSLMPLEGLSINIAGAYIDSQVDDISNGTITANKKLPGTPELELNTKVSYQWPMKEGYLIAQLSNHYQTDQYFDIQNDPATSQSNYSVTNARVSYILASGKMKLSVFINNLTNKEYIESIANNTGFGMIQEYYGRPRWLGLELFYQIQ
ncbi:MAG: TonB-dependent receptor [Colwellia sp.]|nr:TonB-dependent receptor [Colwellia sp.]